MKQRNKKILSFLIIFSLVFSNVNMGILARNVFAKENNVQVTNTEEANLKDMQVTTAQAVTLNAVQESNIEEITVNDAIRVLINYYNKEYYKKNNKKLEGWDYLALKKAEGELTKKDWNVSSDIPKTGAYDTLTTLAGKAKQSIILLELGEDPSNYKSRNLIKEIAEELDKTTKSRFVINEITAMIAVDRFNEAYADKKVNYNVENIMKLVLKEQKLNGCVDGCPQNTAYAIEVFEKHEELEGVKEAKKKSIDYLKQVLKSDGGLYEKYYFTHLQAEAVRELIKSGEFNSVKDWSKDGKNIIDGLFIYWNGKFFTDKYNKKNEFPYPDTLYTLTLLRDAGHGDCVFNGVKFDNLIKEDPEKTCKAKIVIVYPKDDKKLEIKLNPIEVVVSDKKQVSGLTVLGALEAATNKCEFKGGMVTSIFDIKNEGTNGWIYSLNGKIPTTYANETTIKDGDKIVWYYSKNGMASKVPTYDEIVNEINNPGEETQKEGSSINSVINGVINYYNEKHFIENQGQLECFHYGAMAKAGADLTKKPWYLIEKYITNYDKNLSQFGSKVKQSLILLDIGKNPSNFNDRNLIAEIVKEVDSKENYFSQIDIQAIIAIDKYNEIFKDKKVNYDVEHAVNKILEAQGEDGGFKERKGSVPRNTAYALNALSGHRDIAKVNDSINKAVKYLHGLQKEDGSIYETKFVTGYNAEIIQGLIAVGENPTSKEWTKSSGKNLVDALFTLWKDNNSFDGAAGESNNNRGWVEATCKALYALVDLREAGYGKYEVKGIKVKDFNNEDDNKDEKICKVNVAIVVPKNHKYDCMFKPKEVTIGDKKHKAGFTALGALQSSTVLYEMTGSMVTSIYGIENKDLNGWVYTVNGVMPSEMPGEMKLKDGDKVIWYYSIGGMNSKVPTWEELTGTKPDEKPNNKEYIKEVDSAIESVSNSILKDTIGDWQAASLAALNKNIPENYLKDVIEKIKNRDESLFRNGKFKVTTDCERTIIGIVAAGGDPRNVGNYNLLEDLCSRNLIKEPNLYAYMYGLIALDSGKFSLPKNADFTREQLIDKIISQQINEEGWGWGLVADADTTAMVITALSNYTNNPSVKASVDKAVEFLSKLQNQNGGYAATWDEEKGKDTSESVSQTIIALCALKIDPSSEKFTKNNKNLMDNFLSFRTEDGGFAHIKDNLKTSNPFATEQAFRALAAYKRFKDGKTGSIYLLKEFKDENAKDMEIVNLTNESEFKLGSEAKINVKTINNKDEAKHVTLIIGVFDSNDKMVNYVALKYLVKSKDEAELEGMMKLPKDGQYVVKSFVWDSFEAMNSLSNVITIPVLK